MSAPRTPALTALSMAALLALSGCPKTGGTSSAGTPATPQTYVFVHREAPMVCVTRATGAGGVGDAQQMLDSVHTALLDRAYDKALKILVDAPEHPAFQAARAGALLGAGRPQEARPIARQLASELPDDGCAQQGAAMAYLALGALRLALPYADDAWKLAPNDNEVAVLRAMLLIQMGELDESAEMLRDVIARDPNHRVASRALAMHYLGRGDALLALPMLEAAQAAGEDVSGLLAPAYFQANKLDDYLRVASQAGWPLGDQGTLADAAEPLTAFRELLGVGPEGGLTAIIQTSEGPLRCELYWEQAPVTVGNFVGLARGTQAWTDPRTGNPSTAPLYPGTIFHRVIPAFMLQGGDPLGTGTGGPGYQFPDEIRPELAFDRPGVLAMANSGPGTNGSQWFITEVPTSHLTGKHTIFGQCDDETVARVAALGAKPRDRRDRPVTDIRIDKVRFEAR